LEDPEIKELMKLKELSETQRSHLAFRLDRDTCCGYLTACKIARLEYDDMNEWEVWQVFAWAEKTDHSAKILAKKVINFTLK
jgi:hypothetical protein